VRLYPIQIITQMETKSVFEAKLITKNGDAIRGSIELSEKKGDLMVTLTYSGKMMVATSFYFIHALNEIRRKLEKKHISLACNAARMDVITSGMLSDMSMGTLGSVIDDQGEFTGEEVHLFEETEMIDRLGSLKEQLEMKRKLIERNRRG